MIRKLFKKWPDRAAIIVGVALMVGVAIGYVAALNLAVIEPPPPPSVSQIAEAAANRALEPVLAELGRLRSEVAKATEAAKPSQPSEAPVAEVVVPEKKKRPRRKVEGGAFGDFSMFKSPVK